MAQIWLAHEGSASADQEIHFFSLDPEAYCHVHT